MTSTVRLAVRALIVVSSVSLALACGGEDAMGPEAGVTAYEVGLGVGESATYAADGNVLAVQFPSASAGREYRLAVQSTSTGAPDQVIPMRLVRGDGSSGSGSLSASRRAAVPRSGVPPHVRGLMVRQKIRESSREMLVRRGVQPARPSDSGTGSGTGSGGDVSLSSQVPTGRVPQEGEEIQFWFAAQEDFDTPCSLSQVDTVTAVVEEVGDRAAIVQDTAALDPSVAGQGGFSSQDFQEISAAFDTLVVPTDSAYFGTPTDIDHNERVYILFTPKVNELDPEDSDTRVGGFFVPNDLAESGDSTGDGELTQSGACAASNEAELLYLRAPDPDGNWGNATTTEEARSNAFSVSSHELQHLLNAANRVIKNPNGTFGDLETTWLNEALSHLAEEVVGLAAYGVDVRSNLTFSETGGASTEIFNTYLINDFYNAGAFMQASDTARALTASDPGGSESLEMRGFGWLFARWLADHQTTADGPVPGSGEETLIRDLAQADGSELSTGIDNVEGVTGATFRDLLADFDVMVAVDDDVPAADGQRVLPTWNLRNMYRELAANTGSGWPFGGYPLNPVVTDFTDGVTDFEVRPGPGKHFTLSSSGSTPELEIRLTDRSGNALSSSAGARIVIFRAR